VAALEYPTQSPVIYSSTNDFREASINEKNHQERKLAATPPGGVVFHFSLEMRQLLGKLLFQALFSHASLTRGHCDPWLDYESFFTPGQKKQKWKNVVFSPPGVKIGFQS
jgi:hypothetical protein